MKILLCTIILTIVLLSLSACTATSQKATASPATTEAAAPENAAKIEQEIINLENEECELVIKRDVARLEQMLADDHFSTDFNGKVYDKAGSLAQFKNDPSQWDSLTNSEYKVRIYGDTVVVTFLTTGSGKMNGQPIKGQARITDVWMKQKNQWKLAVTQGTIVEGSVVTGKS
jgi:ketosteroid isomerase-like protein